MNIADSSIILKRDGEAAALHFPPGSARGIRTNIAVISSGEVRRTVNGTLVDLTRAQLRKYQISLSADGLALPDLRGMWRGQRVSVAPPVIWSARIPAGALSVTLDRPAAPGSLRAHNPATHEEFEAYASGDGRTVLLSRDQPVETQLDYQPLFDCRITSVSTSGDEWEATATWSIELEEI